MTQPTTEELKDLEREIERLRHTERARRPLLRALQALYSGNRTRVTEATAGLRDIPSA